MEYLVLVLEDEAAQREVVVEWLTHVAEQAHAKVRIDTTTTVAEAVAHIAQTSYDLVVSDLLIAGHVENGMDLLRLIRNEARTADVPFVLLTATRLRESAMAALRELRAEYLLKGSRHDFARLRAFAESVFLPATIGQAATHATP